MQFARSGQFLEFHIFTFLNDAARSASSRMPFRRRRRHRRAQTIPNAITRSLKIVV